MSTTNKYSYCPEIDAIYYNSENPIRIEIETFDNDVYNQAYLYVPENALDKFKETESWCYFKSISDHDFNGVEEISTDIDSTLPYDVFKLSGEYVGNNTEGVTPGIYIIRQGKNVKKITVI